MESKLNYKANAMGVVFFSFLVTNSLIAAECQNAVAANDKTKAYGQKTAEVDCRQVPGSVEFSIVHQFIQDGGPVDWKILFRPRTDEKQGFKVKSISTIWCTDSDGIAVVNVEVNCDTTAESHLYWLESGPLISEKTAISVWK